MPFDIDMADVKPSVYTCISVGLMSVVFIVLGKYFTERYYIPGLSEIFAAV